MSAPNIRFRDAGREDVVFVAWAVLQAVGITRHPEEALVDICSSDDTLYSWRNARMAVVDGTTVGCLISYPGESYAEARRRTFSRLKESLGIDLLDNPLETGPGEFYLDSLAVLPAFRGFGIGRMLLEDGIRKGRRLGYKRITLIVEKDHPALKEYYADLGFADESDIHIFGEDYLKMALYSE